MWNRKGIHTNTSQAYIALLHLDFFYMLGFWIQEVLATERHNNGIMLRVVFAIAIAGLVFAPLQILVGVRAALLESRAAQKWCIGINATDIALIGTQIGIIQVYFRGPFTMDRTTSYGGIAIALLAVTLVLAIVRMRGFGKGLKPILERGRVLDHNCIVSTSLEPLRARMEIE